MMRRTLFLFFAQLAQTCAAVAAVLGLYTLGAWIDAQPSARAETAQSLALQDAQRAAQQEERRQKAAQALCSQEVASQSQATWTPDGQLICQPKRGQGVAMPVQLASK